jgi:hypothetical protein
MTPNVITLTSAKVAMTSRFLGLVGSLPLEEQQLWLPNQQAHDPDSWTVPHWLQLKMEYEVLINKYECKVQEMYTVQDHSPPPSEFLLLPPLDNLYKEFSTGYATIATRSLSSDDEKLETLGDKHAKVYRLKDAPATGLSHATSY